MAKAYLYHFKLSSDASYMVYAESREAAEKFIKDDLGEDIRYTFVERKPF